ncbi:Conserved oligomeric Golgi complex subunit 6 [Rhynchospora pubera]|uniref:Conserved oligomeric Golgi complex subunit 6 n=1 Tax=Rhynchospora pubera TaxID=906938 RepID=A0AAV8BNT2_9POAL|nr:Conserved oligomeric Golgi complex subunit 6 [Rhynchospora pubera]KAJ4774457.1 Conserved oligomeric Golgi complex subunit 6 [Rhynchospora pubera]
MASASTLAPGVARKLKKVLETRTSDNPDVLASLATLSTFYTENTPQARRNLKSSIEQRGLSINDHFLDASLPAQLALDRVEKEVNVLTQCCDQIDKVLSGCSWSTGDIISTTERLQQELEIITQRQEIVSCFLRDYQLSNEEINALREEELNENFFKALAHVQEIHANCKVLLRTHHQRAGLELMDLMSVYQEGAYERLCRWVQAECKKLGDTDNPEVGELLKKAVRCLKERPVLFKYCAEEVANMRHNALFRRFISALTRGGPGGLPRPIEVHAHDPLRYVGDMLGWLHQALASERELILVLLDPDATADSGPAARRLSGIKETDAMKTTEADVTFVLDRIFEGACRPFKVRVEQVLQSQHSLIVSYKLTNTLEFYSFTISELLGKETALCNTIGLLKDAAQQTFFNIVKSRGEKLQRYPPLVPADLSPPAAVREGISVVVELIQSYDSIMLPPSAPKPPFLPVISSLLDPIVQMCEKAAEAHRLKGAISRRRASSEYSSGGRDSLSSVDAILAKNLSASAQSAETSSKIYIINCLSAMEEPLVSHPAASGYVNNLQSMIEKHMNLLVEKETDGILSWCGLSDKISIIQEQQEGGKTLSDIPETSPHILSENLRSFFGLVTGTEGSLPEFEQLQIPRLQSDACSRVARTLAGAYEIVYAAVMDPKNGYADARSLVKHSPHDIRTMLGI